MCVNLCTSGGMDGGRQPGILGCDCWMLMSGVEAVGQLEFEGALVWQEKGTQPKIPRE